MEHKNTLSNKELSNLHMQKVNDLRDKILNHIPSRIHVEKTKTCSRKMN